MEQNQISDRIFNIEVDMIARDHIKTITTWARIIAMIGLINVGLTVLSTVISPNTNGAFGFVAMLFFVLIYMAIVVLVNIFLLRFANNTSAGLNAQSQEQFNLGIGYLNTYFKTIGIIIIVVLGIFVVFVGFAAIGMALR